MPPGFDPQAVAATYQQLKKLALDDYRSVAKEIRDANPGKKWKPTEFITAVDQEFKQRSTLDPDLKEAVLAESAAARAQASYMISSIRAYQGQERIDQGATKISDAEKKQQWYESYEGANQAERARMDKWRQSHGDEEAHSLDSFRSWQETHGDTMAGIARDRANAAGGNTSTNMGREKLEKALEGTAAGKDYAVKKTAYSTLKALHDMPTIGENSAAQLGLINRFLFMSTGSIRPPLAEIKKFLGARDAQDVYDVITKAPGSRPLLGRDQINRIYEAATAEEQASRASALADPVAGPTIKQLEAEPTAGGGSGPGSSQSNPVRPKTKAEAAALPKGTWFVDPTGAVHQRG